MTAVDLREKLQRQYAKLWNVTGFHDGPRRIRQCADWIRHEPHLMSIVRVAEGIEPELDFELWRSRIQHRVAWPCTTAAGEAWLGWRLLDAVAREIAETTENADRPLRDLVVQTAPGGNLTDVYRNAVVPRFFGPLFDYFTEQIEESNAFLYLVTRWVAQVQWFDAELLYAQFEADTSRGEAVYDAHLRGFLFSQGVDMPYSQARTPSGQTDVLASLESTEPFVGEVKLFGKGREKAGLASGVRQAYTYADELAKNVAFLVIVNLDSRILMLPRNDNAHGDEPAYVDVGGVRIFMLVANALPTQESASKRGRSELVNVTRAELVKDIDAQ